jgi:hypothetical protein
VYNNYSPLNQPIKIIRQVKAIRQLIEKHIPNPYSAEGLYSIFQKWILPVPYLWNGREEFREADKWNTTFIDGGIKIVDKTGLPIDPVKRVQNIFNINLP